MCNLKPWCVGLFATYGEFLTSIFDGGSTTFDLTSDFLNALEFLGPNSINPVRHGINLTHTSNTEEIHRIWGVRFNRSHFSSRHHPVYTRPDFQGHMVYKIDLRKLVTDHRLVDTLHNTSIFGNFLPRHPLLLYRNNTHL